MSTGKDYKDYPTSHFEPWSPEGIFRSLPTLIQESACSCVDPDWWSYYQLYWNPERDPNYNYWEDQKKQNITLGIGAESDPVFHEGKHLRRLPQGSFCKKCMKPHRYSINYIYRACEGCDRYYVPKIALGTYPIKYFLCERCDNVPTRNRRGTR